MSAALTNCDLNKIHTSISQVARLPTQNFYSLLTAFSIYLQTKKREKARAADGLQINDEHVATGLKSVRDAALLAMMWHTFGRAIDTCSARKHQLTLSASGELFFTYFSS
ncbi:hypothetical protein PHMEG_00029209 [Phytophthora megakarya]|uniref:Uncharacterized protein n=1 Tax=Phytophthora megakarya TaxID=4795 RepID=A0A225V354_9STRA|nr:hypothetical protein PHMEG_00029209 [Phytophthora megakarya]